jgi:protein O-mannosyl-transferase
VDPITLRLAIPFLGLVAVTLNAYVGAFRGNFQYDDFLAILNNPHLDQWNTFVGHLDHMVRPFLHLTFFIDRSLYGDAATGYHVLNFLLHLGSGFLIYGILCHAVTEEAQQVPFGTAMVFLIHPISTETVTYISGRASGLMAFWYLLALFLYIKESEETNGHLSCRLYRAGALLCFVLSVASKEPAVTFPLALLLWDVFVRRLSGASLRAAIVSHHLPFWLIIVVVGVLAWRHPRYADLAQFGLGIRPLWEHLLSELHAVAYAFWLIISPWNQNFDHDLPVLHSLFEWPLPLDLFVWCGFAIGACVLARRLPLLTFGMGWFVLQMLPTSVIPRNDLLSERNLYLASFGFVLAIVVLCSRVTQWLETVLPQPRVFRFGAKSLAAVLVLVLCLFTYQRNRLYYDQVSLWSDTVRMSPNKARPHNNLGHAYALQGDWDQAIDEFRIAVRLNPDYALAQKNLRDAYLHQVGRQ